MKEENEKIACHVCKKIIPKAAALHSEGEEYVFHFCNIECLDYWKEKKKKNIFDEGGSNMCEDDIFCGVNKAKTENIDEMSDLEKKHTPVIEAPAKVKKGEPFEVQVEVGKHMNHPNENAHYIEWIELFSGDTFLARVDLVPRLTEPKVKFVVALDHAHPLVARERCNLHGQWESIPFEIEVE